MIIDEQDCADRINAYTIQDWQPLLALIPEIETTSNFGEWAGGDKGKDWVIQFPYCHPVPIVSQFLKIAYAIPIIISFDWGSWDEGRKITNDEGFDFDTIDLVTKCKLITAIVRNDRFCKGALVSVEHRSFLAMLFAAGDVKRSRRLRRRERCTDFVQLLAPAPCARTRSTMILHRDCALEVKSQ